MIVSTNGERYRTALYRQGNSDKKAFTIAEKLKGGSLITDFNEYGEIIDQKMAKDTDPFTAIKSYFGDGAIKISKGSYEPVRVKILCPICKKESTAIRELDTHPISNTNEVPVVQLFRCEVCNTKFYSITEEYLNKLIERNIALFEKNELEEMKKDSAAFRRELKEYIIRIFASKKIFRLEIKK